MAHIRGKQNSIYSTILLTTSLCNTISYHYPKDISFFSLDSTTNGNLKKRWKMIEENICLIKGGSRPFQQQPFNEAIASAIMRRLGISHGYTESDEISLLFHPEENTFARKVRKINTTLAGEASAYFSLQLGKAASFDCRVCPLPNIDKVIDYFLWRQEDSHRNSLNGHCYWALRKEGMTQRRATSVLEGKGGAFKNELLFQKGINYNDLPTWQKRGIGLYFTTIVPTTA